MSTTISKPQQVVRLKSRPQNMPSEENFEIVQEPVPEPREGEILVCNEYLSVDPYMRGRMRDTDSYVAPFGLGEPMEGGCLGRVVRSRNSDFLEGDCVVGNQGWRRFWCSDGSDTHKVNAELVPPQSYLGVLGMTGMTAYVGLLKIGALRDGETVFVSAASGAVGSIVCQIAKLKGCRVIGSSGSAQKIQWLREKAHIDDAFNYHDVGNVSEKLAELCPRGIDVYFDNVGGDHLEGAIDNMNDFGRIVCCGMISSYNDDKPAPGPSNLFKIIGKRLRIQGFIVRDHADVQQEFQREMTQWIQSGQIVWEETITEGIENAPQAFIGLFKGDKMGKALVRV